MKSEQAPIAFVSRRLNASSKIASDRPVWPVRRFWYVAASEAPMAM
jgi:hypothetical protein